jgi:competence protein ComEA
LAAGTKSAQPISLNRGTQSELEALPGVGPTLASRIIDWRIANGGFKKIEDLKNVTGIGAKLFAQIKTKATL